ncbi:hypothetical protein M8848_09855 [Pasteurella multocida]|uniref:hypothetical protein n=1 Tax=Pasteurella multocida TaxID=747 RepID=UPI0020234826|nr:hypothetical protein [Pasteurella multocida]URH77947.1 hypothetical protein M8848_09855 [Pasteurella multocida]
MKLGFNPFSLRKKVKHWRYVAGQQAIIIEQSKTETNNLKLEIEQLKDRIKCLEEENAKLIKVKNECFKLTTGLRAIRAGIHEIPVIDLKLRAN